MLRTLRPLPAAMAILLRGAVLMAALMAGHALAAPVPQWIWHPNEGRTPGEGEIRFFQKTFTLDHAAKSARLLVSADNHFILFLNGKRVGEGHDWAKPQRFDVADTLRVGPNLIAVEAANDAGPAALLVRLEVVTEEEEKLQVISDRSWRTSHQRVQGWMENPADPDGWVRANSLGKLGSQPWGDVTKPRAATQAPRQATPADQLQTLPGFEVALIRNAGPEEGSWVGMTLDTKGRLIVSPQNARQPLLRFTLAPDGSVAQKETIHLGVGEAMGLFFADDTLYANAKGPVGTGLYRLYDSNGDDQLDRVKFLHPMRGGGEHGPHGVRRGPDGRLYVMNGNHTKIPEGTISDSPHRNYAEDLLLPRAWDGNGHARGILAPGGYVARTADDGETWELLLAGFRNSYDFDLDDEGEMFTFDSDMEWDWGMPWYRPTVVYHCVSAADFGWRSGTGKWPWYFADTLPPVLKVGIGSPTGVKFGRGARFPARYQKALYIMDWTYGRILAVLLQPKGASYTATMEPFVQGRPLNVTDMEVGADGALYFTTGGRGTQSGLYRVHYTGEADTSAVPIRHEEGRQARALRRQLEQFHAQPHPEALEVAWPHLGSQDRFIRHAARIAVERQPLDQWRQRALQESSTQASLTALLALARNGEAEDLEPLFEALSRTPPDIMTRSQQLQALRVASLAFIRLGEPGPGLREDILNVIDPIYPAEDATLNRELCRLLVYLRAPKVVPRTLDLMESASTQEDQIHYLVALRTLEEGWTLQDRRRYFSWFNRDRSGLQHPPELLQWFEDVNRAYNDGASFNKFIAKFKETAEDTLSDEEKAKLAPILEGKEQLPALAPTKARVFVKDWTWEDLEPHLAKVDQGRSFAQGREAFTTAQCLACHKFGNEGGATGQELTAVASRYTRRDILDSILHPSKVVSEQYQNTTFYLDNGEDVTGRVVDEENGLLVIEVNPINQVRVKVKASDIERKVPSKLSPMPEGLLNSLTLEEILDLLAFLESGGRRDHPAFQ